MIIQAHEKEEPSERIAVISDMHVGEYKGKKMFDPGLWKMTAGRVNGYEPDLVLFPGDITASGAGNEFEMAAELLEQLRCQRRVFTCGQRDRQGGSSHFAGFFGELPTYRRFGELAVISLDSTDLDKAKMADEVNVLAEEIAKTTAMLEMARPGSDEEYARNRDYYDNVMTIYVNRMKRLEEHMKSHLDFGFVGRRQRKWATDVLKKVPPSSPKVVMLHYSLCGDDYFDNELLDRGNIRRACLETDVNLAVTGDRHFSRVETFNEGGRQRPDVVIFQAGSATCRQRDPNQYATIGVDWNKRTFTLCSYYVRTGEPARDRFHGNVNYPVTFPF